MSRHNRAISSDDFRVINKQKENVEGNKTINDKILLMEKQLAYNESYNDQYLLTNSADNSALQIKNGSISFHFQSIDADKSKAAKSYNDEYVSQPQSAVKGQPPGDSALVLLLNEFEKRFEQIEGRLEKSERFNRQTNQNHKFVQECLTQLQDKFKEVVSRISRIEFKLKALEEGFNLQKNQTEKRIIEFNQHVDTSLKQFIDSSIKIQKKIDRLTQKDPTQEIEVIKQKTDNLTMNLAKTHELLSNQMMEFQNLQCSVNKVNNSEFFNEVGQEMCNLREQYNQVLQYLRELQECLAS